MKKTENFKIPEYIKEWIYKTRDFAPNDRKISQSWQKAEARRSYSKELWEEIDKVIDSI